jgi:hypothetical protein
VWVTVQMNSGAGTGMEWIPLEKVWLVEFDVNVKQTASSPIGYNTRRYLC